MPLPKSFAPLTVPLCLIIAGCLQTFSFAPYGLWILGPLSIALTLYSIKALNPEPAAPRSGFFHGWLFGLGLFGSGASWVYVSINTYGHAPPLLAGSLTVIFVAGLALFCGLNFWVYAKLKRQDLTTNALIFTAIWVLGDGFRTVFLTGFPWLFLGYAHLDSPLAGWIPIIGVYGLTGIVVLSGAALTIFILKLKNNLDDQLLNRRTMAYCVSFVGVLWLTGPVLNMINWSQPVLDSEGKPMSHQVALLQTNIPQELKWKSSQRRKTLRLLESITQEQWDKDLILWPETAIPQLYDLAQPFIKSVDAKAKKNASTIISGIPYRSIDAESGQQTIHNSIISIGQGQGIYHKQKLVPFGEYVPLQDILRGLIQFFDLPMSDFRTGPSEQDNLYVGAYKTSPFICYEVVYPNFVASRAVDSQYLLTISNDSWFGTSIGPLQHLEMAQFRAAENARFMVRGTNNGVSAVINEKGEIIAQTDQFVRTSLESSVDLMKGRTPFSYLQSYPIFLLSLCLLIYHYLRKRRT